MLELLNQLDGFEATNKIKVGLGGWILPCVHSDPALYFWVPMLAAVCISFALQNLFKKATAHHCVWFAWLPAPCPRYRLLPLVIFSRGQEIPIDTVI